MPPPFLTFPLLLFFFWGISLVSVWCCGNKWFIPMSHVPPLSHAFPVLGTVSQGLKWVPFVFDFQPSEK